MENQVKPSTTNTAFSLTPELRDALKSLADQRETKLSALVEDLLWRSKAVRDEAAKLGLERRERRRAGRPALVKD